MRKFLSAFLAFTLVYAQVAQAANYIDGDTLRSPDHSLSWPLPTSSGPLVGRDSVDTLTNKTLTAPVITSPTGLKKSDIGLAGMLSNNFFYNSDLNYSANGFVAFDNGGTYTNGAGGSPTATAVRSTSNPLEGAGSLLYTPGASANQGFSVDFTTDASVEGDYLETSFVYKIATGAAYACDTTFGGTCDLKVVIVDKDGSFAQVPTVSGSKLEGKSLGKTNHLIRWQTVPGHTHYRLSVYQGTANTAYGSVKFDKFSTGVQITNIGPVQTNCIPYSPTVTNGPNVGASDFCYKQMGDVILVKGTLTASAASSGGSDIRVSAPSGYKLVGGYSNTGSGWFYNGVMTTLAPRVYDENSINFVINNGVYITGAYFANGGYVLGFQGIFSVSGHDSSTIYSSDVYRRDVSADIALNNAQTLGAGTLSKINFNMAYVDKAGAFEPGGYRVQEDGLYHMSGAISLEAVGVSNYADARIYIDNDYTCLLNQGGSIGVITAVPMDCLRELKKGQLISVYVYNGVGQNRNVIGNDSAADITHLTITKIETVTQKNALVYTAPYVYVLAGDGTLTLPPNAAYAKLRMIGAGGNGGGGTPGSPDPGGGAGCYGEKTITELQPSYTYHVAPGASSGQDSNFGSYTAGGGAAGNGTQYIGGSGGGCAGDFDLVANGARGMSQAGVNFVSGAGADSFFGGGGYSGGTGIGTGGPGAAYGAGGGGGANGGNGGPGAPGWIEVTVYFKNAGESSVPRNIMLGSASDTGEVTAHAWITSAGGCHIMNPSKRTAWITSLDNPSTGQCNINTNIFSDVPDCTMSQDNQQVPINSIMRADSTATSIKIQTANDASVFADAGYHIICVGPK